MDRSLKECLKLQDELNSQINPDWKKKRSEAEFFRAIWLECAEAMESLPWKWWKKMDLDLENLEIEIADIFHFVLSISLLRGDSQLVYFKKALNSDFSNLAGIDGEYLNHYLADVYSRDRIDEYMFLIERVAEMSLRKHYDGVLFFFGLLVKDTIGFDKLYLLYTGKNILNRIRQEMGYKSGGYTKLINGVEDNRYLLDLVKKTADINTLENQLREILGNLTEGR